jgi:hypothetical protein
MSGFKDRMCVGRFGELAAWLDRRSRRDAEPYCVLRYAVNFVDLDDGGPTCSCAGCWEDYQILGRFATKEKAFSFADAETRDEPLLVRDLEAL